MSRALSTPEFNAVLAALRMLEGHMAGREVSVADVELILNNDGTEPALDEDGVGRLIDRLLTSEINIIQP